MSKALQQFEETFQLLNEVITPMPPASGAIAATNDEPRKDFGAAPGNGYPPSMNRKGIVDPYQSHPELDMGDSQRPPHLPYPLDTINDFLADSIVYLDASLKQIKAVVDNNPTMDPIQKQELKKLYTIGVQAFKRTKYIGNNLTKIANLNY